MTTALDTLFCPRCGYQYRSLQTPAETEKTLSIPRDVLDAALARPAPPAELPLKPPTVTANVPAVSRNVPAKAPRALAWAIGTLAVLLAMSGQDAAPTRLHPHRHRVSRQLFPAILRAAASATPVSADADAQTLPAPPATTATAAKTLPATTATAAKTPPAPPVTAAADFVFASTPTQRLAPAAPHALSDLQQWLQWQPAPPSGPPPTGSKAAAKSYNDTVHLYLSGHILLVQPGTPARIMDVKGPWRLVDITDGPYRGQTVYVAAASLTHKKPEPTP